MQSYGWFILGGILLLAFLFYKEIKRAVRARLLWRLLASVVMVGAFTGMIVPLYMNSVDASFTTQTIILLTPGYNQDSVNNYRSQHPALAVYHVDSLVGNEVTAGKKLEVFGDGLISSEWKYLQPSAVILHEGPAPFGINNIYWKQQLSEGEMLRVQGRFNNNSNDSVRLLLTGFEHHFDSFPIAPHQQETFTLTTVPSNIGKAVYTLEVQLLQQSVKEPLPVLVQHAGKTNVLMLASAPDFENKFLSDWLSQHDYTVAMRTAISKKKYAQAFIDTAKFNLDHLNAATLERFDLLIADASALHSLQPDELAAVERQVSENSCGLIIKADTVASPQAFYNKSFSLTQPVSVVHELALLLPGFARTSTLSVSQAVYIKPGQGIKAIVTDSKENALAAASLYGTGKLIYSTLSDTYTWVLSGHDTAYNALWSAVISAAIQKKQTDERWQVSPFILKAAVPATVALETADEQPVMYCGDGRIALSQHAFYRQQWSGTWWPRTSGWTSLRSNKANLATYIFKEEDWKNISLLRNREQTKQYAASASNSKVLNRQHTSQKEFPKYLFFALFLLSCAFLWMEKKFA